MLKANSGGASFKVTQDFSWGMGAGGGGRTMPHGENVAPVCDENTNKEWLAPTRPWGYF